MDRKIDLTFFLKAEYISTFRTNRQIPSKINTHYQYNEKSYFSNIIAQHVASTAPLSSFFDTIRMELPELVFLRKNSRNCYFMKYLLQKGHLKFEAKSPKHPSILRFRPLIASFRFWRKNYKTSFCFNS